MLKFYIPILYSFETRFNNKVKMVGWFFTYLFPVSLMFFILNENFNIKIFLILIISIVLIYTVYEVGYIENDAETIKLEKNPTLRLSLKSLEFYEINKRSIYLTRLMITFILLTGVFYLNAYNINYFILILFFLLILFKVYNISRSRLNLFIQFFLSSIRYLAIALLTLESIKYTEFLILFLIFPAINFIEWMTKERFNIKPMINLKNKIDLIRVLYYFLCITIGLAFFQENKYFNVYIILISYFFLYRIFTYYISTRISKRAVYK